MNLILGLAIGSPCTMGGGEAVALTAASTRIRVPNRTASLNTGSSFMSALNRISAGSPPWDITDIRVCIPGFYCNNAGGTPTERVMPNNFDAAYWLEVSGTRHRAKFGGNGWTSRGGTGASRGYSTPFDWGVWSDIIADKALGTPLVVPANTNIFHCSLIRVATVGDLFPASQYLASTVGDACRNSTESTGATLEALADGSGAITTSGSSPAQQFTPMYMVGRRVDNGAVVSILLTGDSRAYYANDFGSGLPSTEPRGALAALERGLDSLTGGRIPTISITIPGSGPAQSYNGVYGSTDYAPGLTHRVEPLLVLKAMTGALPFTHILDQHGNNGNPTYATLIGAHVSTIKGYFPGIPYGKVSLPPRVGSTTTDAYKTLAGMSPAAYDTYPSGGRAVYNDAILANASSDFDFVFDAGIYGTAAYNPSTGDKLPPSDPDFNDKRSKFMTAPRTATVATTYSGTTTIVLNSSLQVGDTIAVDDDRTHICGPIRLITDNGNGTWTHTIQVGGNASGAAAAVGATVTVVPTTDGTHEEAWLHKVEAQAYIDMKTAGMFGTIPT